MPEEKSKINTFTDIILPTFAFLSAASGPYGAAGAQALTGVLSANERRRTGQRREAQNERALQLEQEATAQKREDTRPQRELAAAQSGFQLGNLQDIQSILGAQAPTQGAVQALGQPTTARLQEALGRGEQVPLPQEAPTPQVRQERLGQLASTPQGSAQLTAAGLGDVAQRAQALLPKPEDPRQLAEDKRKALGVVRGFDQSQIDANTSTELRRAISKAKTQDDLTDAIAAIPISAGAPKGSIDEQVYRELTLPEEKGGSGLTGIEALSAMSQAKRKPEAEGEADLRRARIAKLRSDVAKNSREESGKLSGTEARKLQLKVRGDIRQEPVYKDYQSALSGYTSVSVGQKRQDAQGDLAILNGITRLLDPGSVVRPSEFETAKKAQGLIEQLQVILPRVEKGDVLSPDARQRYISLGNQLIREYGNRAKTEVGQVYGSLLQDTGLSLDNVFVQPDSVPGSEAAPQAELQDPASLKPEDLSKLTPEQLDALEKQLQGAQ